MKRGVIVILLLVSGGFARAVPPVNNFKLESGAIIEFDAMTHDFGTMREGDSVSCIFKFTNKGDGPLIIEHVEEPCGCTVPHWSKQPVMPGQSGEIRVVFRSKDRPGVFRKTLAVKSNAVLKNHEEILLMIKGNVLTRKEWRERANGSKN